MSPLYVIKAHDKYLCEEPSEGFWGTLFYPLYIHGWTEEQNEALTFGNRLEAQRKARKYQPCATVHEASIQVGDPY